MKSRPRSKLDIVSEEIISSFIEIMKEKCPELRPIGTGGGVRDGKITVIGVVFQDDHPITLLQARSYIVTCGIEMEKIILENPEYLKFFDPDVSPVVTFDHAIIAARSEIYPLCSIVQTSMYQGDIRYRIYEDEDRLPTNILEEPFEEARLLVKEQNCLSNTPSPNL